MSYSELAASVSALNTTNAVLVQAAMESQEATGNSIKLANYSALRNYKGSSLRVEITQSGIAGYFRRDATVSADNDGATFLDGLGRGWRRDFTGNVKVSWFTPDKTGGTDSFSAFNAAAVYALTLQNGLNAAPIVEIDQGTFLVSAPTAKATWWLNPGAEIDGLPGVAPSYHTDTSRLTGTVFRFSGIDQYGTLYVGDSKYTVQKAIGRAMSSQLIGSSNKAAGGVAGISYSSARDGADQGTIGTIGVGYNDNIATPKTAWGVYAEGIRAVAGTGNAFGVESSAFNYAPLVASGPYQQPGETTGVTIPFWASALGDYDCTAAMGIITAGKKFNQGIIFYNNSLVSGEAVVMPLGYQMTWHSSGSSGKVAYVGAGIIQQLSADAPCYIRGVRGGATTTTNTLLKYESWSGNNAGAEVVLAEQRIYQTSAYAGGFASSRWDWSVRNAAGSTTRVYLSASAHYPETTNVVSSGQLGNSWVDVFATRVRPGLGSAIWTSGVGSPNGVLSAPPGSMYTNENGGAGATLWIKESGSGNTGWVAK